MADGGVRQAAAANPEDKFALVFRHLVEALFVERMDQNEDIFVRFMNDPAFQQVVTGWMASRAYQRLRADDGGAAGEADQPPAPPSLELVRPSAAERYVSCVPLVPLRAAAGAFGDPQHLPNEEGWDWVRVGTRRRLRPGMFVAQVVGRSMEPDIPDGAHCLFSAPVTGTRQGKTLLVELRDAVDPETGERYTLKRYESAKRGNGAGGWRHAAVTLRPANPDFAPIALSAGDEDRLRVVAELLEVLRG